VDFDFVEDPEYFKQMVVALRDSICPSLMELMGDKTVVEFRLECLGDALGR